MDSNATNAVITRFRGLSDQLELLFLALCTGNGTTDNCVGYAFVRLGDDLFVPMRQRNSTWQRRGGAGEVSFALGSVSTEQISGRADWQAGDVRADVWSSNAWSLLQSKYPWVRADVFDGEPIVVRLRPTILTLLRFDASAARLWKSTIAADARGWRIVADGPKEAAGAA